MGKWKTVPNFFPDEDELHPETLYHLAEGFGITEYKTKLSGKYYKRVWTNSEHRTMRLIAFLGFKNWHEEWKPNKSIIGRIFNTWKEK